FVGFVVGWVVFVLVGLGCFLFWVGVVLWWGWVVVSIWVGGLWCFWWFWWLGGCGEWLWLLCFCWVCVLCGVVGWWCWFWWLCVFFLGGWGVGVDLVVGLEVVFFCVVVLLLVLWSVGLVLGVIALQLGQRHERA
ncbi:hypothetical protein RA268_28090, partial [Pseudomonas syringae pv. tagetis]